MPFCNVLLSESICIFAFGPSSLMLFIHSTFLLCSLGCHILLKNCFASFSSGCWYVFEPSPPTCRKNFISLFWNVRFCLYCFTLIRYLFNLPSFTSTFWFISSSCTVIFTSVAFSFLSQHVPAFFLYFITFACCRKFLICISSWISRLGFEFMFLFLLGELQFFHRLISLLTMIFFVEICVNNSFFFFQFLS